MRPRTIAIAAVTVDGKIARNSHELVRWTSKEDKEFFRAETARMGVMILGNATFETFPGPLPNRLHIVMTRDLQGKKNIKGVVEFTTKSPNEILEDLGAREVTDVTIAGGSSIYSLYAKEKLLDELWVSVEPKVFGEGVPIMSGMGELDLELLEERLLNKHSILLKYRVHYP